MRECGGSADHVKKPAKILPLIHVFTVLNDCVK
jgi:hypothetical protein